MCVAGGDWAEAASRQQQAAGKQSETCADSHEYSKYGLTRRHQAASSRWTSSLIVASEAADSDIESLSKPRRAKEDVDRHFFALVFVGRRQPGELLRDKGV